MCLITVMPPVKDCKAEFNYDWLKNAHRHNHDGAGFSYIKNVSLNPELVVIKGLFKINNFIKCLVKYRSENPESYFLVHQRAASKGNVIPANCHPFLINKYISFAHNGTLPEFTDKTKSDTFLFNEFLKELPKDWYKRPIYNKLISRFVQGNKLAFLKIDNSIMVTNLNDWKKEGQYTFSNEYYLDTGEVKKNVCHVCGKYGIYFYNDKYYCYEHRNGYTVVKNAYYYCKHCNRVLSKNEEAEGICVYCKNKGKK